MPDFACISHDRTDVYACITRIITENTWVDCVLEETRVTRTDGLQTTRRYQWMDDGRAYRVTDDWDSDGRPDAVTWYDYTCPQ